MLRMLWAFIVRSQERTPMLLTHLGSCPGVGLRVWGRPGGFVGGFGDGGGLALTPTVREQFGAVTWRGLTHHLLAT